jgi:hypothetical protein
MVKTQHTGSRIILYYLKYKIGYTPFCLSGSEIMLNGMNLHSASNFFQMYCITMRYGIKREFLTVQLNNTPENEWGIAPPVFDGDINKATFSL